MTVMPPKGKAYREFNSNNNQLVLYRILCGIGGPFGLIMRHQVSDITDIEESSYNFEFLKWLKDDDLIDELKRLSEKVVKRAVVKTSPQGDGPWWYLCDSHVRRMIQLKARNWAKKNRDFLTDPQDIVDNISYYIWSEDETD